LFAQQRIGLRHLRTLPFPILGFRGSRLSDR
jgi:hypothetical protein